MSERRNLIVVSNRGPLAFARESGRQARRGGGGLVTALAPLVSFTTSPGSRTRSATRTARSPPKGAFEETGRDGSRYRLRLVRHDAAAFGLYYNEFANPALWFLQHEMAELVERPSDEAWESYGRVNANVADASSRSSRTTPTLRSGSTTTTSTWHRRSCAPRGPMRRSRTSSTSPGPRPRGLERAAGRDVRAIHERPLRLRRRRLPHAALARAFLDTCGGLGLDPDERRVTAHPISIDPREFDAPRPERAGARRGRELT